MKNIIKLLKQKNDYLKQFEKMSTEEYHRLCLGDYNHIDQFYHNRQKLLKAIDKIDQQLHRSYVDPTQECDKGVSKKDKATMLSLLKEKKRITLTVLQTDLLIHAYLNDTKYDTVKDQIA